MWTAESLHCVLRLPPTTSHPVNKFGVHAQTTECSRACTQKAKWSVNCLGHRCFVLAHHPERSLGGYGSTPAKLTLSVRASSVLEGGRALGFPGSAQSFLILALIFCVFDSFSYTIHRTSWSIFDCMFGSMTTGCGSVNPSCYYVVHSL